MILFSIIGISKDYERIAKKTQDYAVKEEVDNSVLSLLQQIEDVCNQSYHELEIELKKLNKSNDEK